MTHRERILAAMRREPVDYLPCSIYFNSNLRVEGCDCSNPEGRLALAERLGTDPFLSFGLGHSAHSAVRTETWTEEPKGSEYPLLWQAWDTPEGRLTMAVKVTPDAPFGNSISWGDHSAGRIHKPLIESAEDVKKFAYVFQPLSEADFVKSTESRKRALDLADEYDVPVVCTYGTGLATLLFVLGAQNAVLLAVDAPDLFAELADTIHLAEVHNIELAARAGAHILKRFGGYEQTNFYTPAIFEEIVLPKLKAETARAHEQGLLIFYRVVTGMTPLLDRIASAGFDGIEGGEPHLSNCSLERWRDAFTGKACSWTGVSTPALLGGADPEAVRAEVRHAAEVFGKRGFILGVTNSIRNHFPWRNTLAMVEAWKNIR